MTEVVVELVRKPLIRKVYGHIYNVVQGGSASPEYREAKGCLSEKPLSIDLPEGTELSGAAWVQPSLFRGWTGFGLLKVKSGNSITQSTLWFEVRINNVEHTW